MNEVTHTPGPWVLVKLERFPPIYNIEAEHLHIARLDRTDTEQAKVDAHLIAAAPDLLAACETTEKWLSWWLSNAECGCEYSHICGYSERHRELEQLRVAIAKAKP